MKRDDATARLECAMRAGGAFAVGKLSQVAMRRHGGAMVRVLSINH